ncbi:MAG: histidinol-phosphate aminotransferase family protein [Candidatus Methanoplasma sp.]|jgi:threonine-phosphate decarboxylase|nr:histidinol-phosphate aminotransferase family protein [Candidatus Methanoplasma sp.]
MIRSRDSLSALTKTVHGGQAWKLDGIEDFSHNLNPFGPPEGLAEMAAAALEGVGHYPDDSCADLRDAVARSLSVGAENVVAGAGSSEIIRNFPNALLERGDRALICAPSFAEYAQQCRIAGVGVVPDRLLEEEDFRMSRERVSEALRSGVRAVYVCNPNNPTGRIEPRSKILDMARECADMGALMFLDETLLDLVPGHEGISCAGHAKRLPNLLVARSLTKSFAIPGIRVGFGIGSEELIGEMDKVRMSWNLGCVEQAVAAELVRRRAGHVDAAARAMAEESKAMRSALSDIGFPVGPASDSFFYFTPTRELGVRCAELQRLMLEGGVMIRDCASFGEPFEWFARFSVKDRRRNALFVEAAAAAIRGLR